MTDITDKVALITGASRGIGAEAARHFAQAGAKVVLLARSGEAVADLAGEIGEAAVAIPCDVSRYWEVQTAIQETVKAFGRLDIMINNAAVIDPIGAMETVDPEAYGQLIDINVKGVFHGMRAASEVMLAQGSGTIITISSGAAHNPVLGWVGYCSSKAAAKMLTDCAHREWAERGLRVMGLSPGTVATDMQRVIKDSGINAVSQLDWSAHIPPEWVAKALVWMCTSEADDLLGQELSLRSDELKARIGL